MLSQVPFSILSIRYYQLIAISSPAKSKIIFLSNSRISQRLGLRKPLIVEEREKSSKNRKSRLEIRRISMDRSHFRFLKEVPWSPSDRTRITGTQFMRADFNLPRNVPKIEKAIPKYNSSADFEVLITSYARC